MSITVTQAGETLLVAFPYDPDLIAAVKLLPGRTWNKSRKRWEVPATVEAFEQLRSIAAHHDIPLTAHPSLVAAMSRQKKAEALASVIARTDMDPGTIEYAHRTEPYQHQRAGLAFLATTTHGGLLWEMGLGKTKTAIDYAEWSGAHPVLVITPNSVVDNWGAEIEKHAGHSDYILLRAPMTLLQRARKLATKRYSVVNTEVMQSGPLAKAILDVHWGMVILDESQRFKNPRAQRTKRLLKLQADRRVILTGTPLTNSPEDLWSQLTFLRPGVLGSWWSFQQEYLLRDIFGNTVGMRHGAEAKLADKMATLGYRRLKSEVLDLPEKVYEDRHVEMTPEQARHYRSMRDELRMQVDTSETVIAHNILSQLLRLTQITAGLYGQGDTYEWDPKSAKLRELDDILLDDLRDKQVVIFGLYRRELEELADRYGQGTSTGERPIIYGGVKPERRQELIDQFQAGQRRLLFAQAHSGGIGINLTAAQTAVYYTRGWSLEDYLQSQDRLHRIGQTGTVNIIHLVAKTTVDEQIAKALSAKSDLSRRLTGDAARALAADVLGA